MLPPTRKLRSALTLLLIATLAASALAVPGGPAGTQGAYKVKCRGTVEGRGNAALGGQSLTLSLNLTTGNLVVSGLPVNNGRFDGTAQFNGETVSVCGRIEAPDGHVVSTARICGSIAFPGGGYARFVGARSGS
jgi:hypothetical protein